MCDYVVMVEERAKVFLAGPPLVKMATGEESDDESLGGAEMHARISGLADYFARRRARRDPASAARSSARLNWRKLGPPPTPRPGRPPLYDAEELLGIVPTDLKVPFDPREVIARDRRRLGLRRVQAAATARRWSPAGRDLHGYPIGILANARGVLFSEESQKAAQFIQLANQADTPLLFLQNTTGYMVGKEYEQGGIIKHGAKMINAVSNSTVPHLTVMMGASYGAGNYGMCGRAYEPRFLFTWPNAKSAVMGPAQLAGVLSIVARQAAAARGQDYDEAGRRADARRASRQQIEARVARAVPVRACSTTTGSSTRATPAPCSASRCRPCTARRSRAPRGFGVFRL